jgi:hypothetical protein
MDQLIENKLHFRADLFGENDKKLCSINSEVPQGYNKDDVLQDLFGFIKPFEGLFGFNMDDVRVIQIKSIS